MEFTPMTYKETFHLIQELNTLVDELDGVVLRTQQQYKVRKERMAAEHTRNLSKFDEDCQSAVTATRVRAQKLVSEAQEIQNEMRSMDGKLASVDKYYVKTKRKRESELANVKDKHYDANGDYFDTLNHIKQDYAELSRRYSEDILPGLINGLNYLFSSKRKRDYE